jgi:cell division protein FtsB
VGYIGLKNLFRYNKFKIEYARLQEDYEDEQKRHLDYLHQLASMQSPDYWELQAKAKLGLVCPGERVIKIMIKESK